MLWSSIVCALSLLAIVDSARILGLFPLPSVSHQYVFRALTMELAKRGHELVVMTTDPVLPKNRPPDNITEIDMSFTYGIIREMQTSGKVLLKRGVLVDAELMASMDSFKDMIHLYEKQFEHPEMKKLIVDKNEHFDLIIVESFLSYHLVLSDIFKAPIILMSSFHGLPENYEVVGAVARHPVLYPNTFRQKTLKDLNLLEIFYELKLEYRLMQMAREVEEYESKLLKANFGPSTPTVTELKNNVEFLLINSNPMFCNNRPVPANVAFVGPLHLQPVKDLPQEIKSYLDSSKKGVIYVSLGTNVRPSGMDEDLLDAFLDAFEALPYDILWKFDGDSLKRKPANLKIEKWFPQRDLLVHPNIKLFVTQGGLQSADEAIDSEVPLVAIPMLGDQFYNADKFVQLGIGVKLDTLTLDANALIEGINTVLKNDSYKINIRNIKAIVHDHYQTPMERAVWWTEYVIRHGGAKHFRSPAANISWAEYLMADVLIALAAVALALLVIIVLLIRFVVSTFCSKPTPKTKRS